MKNLKGYFAVALVAFCFSSAGTYAANKFLYAESVASMNSSGVTAMLSHSPKGEGYVAVTTPGKNGKAILTPNFLTFLNDRGVSRLSVSILNNEPRIIFYNNDGSVAKVISLEDMI